jgi:hypothetical protein
MTVIAEENKCKIKSIDKNGSLVLAGRPALAFHAGDS